MKKKLALFLAVVLAVSQLGGYIPANAADGRIVMEPSEVKGNRIVASAVEETTHDGVDVLKITPDGETADSVLLDNYDILDLTVSQEENKYVAVDYYFEAEADGSWTGWNINTNAITDKTVSDAKSEELGTTIEDFDATVLGVSYMAKLTDKIGSYKISQDIAGVSQGDTYVFSFDYYLPVGGRNTYGIRITNSTGGTSLYMNNIDTQNSDVDGYGHVMMTYTVQNSDVTKLTPFVKHDTVTSGDNIGYYWNFSFTKVARSEHTANNMSNLLTNADFATENGSWIGWKFEWNTSVADKTASDTMTTKYGYEIVPFDEELLGRAADYHVAKVINHYTGNSTTNRTKMNQKLVPEAGATYRFSCDYYLPAGARGKLNINSSSDIDSRGSSSEAIWVAAGTDGDTKAKRGTMVVEYTAKENDTYIQPRFYIDTEKDNKATGYFWNLRLIKVGDTTADKLGTGENLLTNADFTVDDDKVPENMVLRMINPDEPEAGTPSINSIVANQWARAIFDYSDFFATYGEKGAYPGIYKQMHFFPWGQTEDSKGTTAEGTMYINNMSFYKEYPGTPSVTGLSFISEQVQVVRGGSVRIPTVTATGENYPVAAHDLKLSGSSSESTYLSDGYLYVGADEEAETITLIATSVNNAEVTAKCTVNVKDVKVEYRYVEDIAEYRSGEMSYPDLVEGYIFAGWYQGTADVVPTTDETLTPVATTTTDGGAWAKYVPEETLVVKAQTTDSIADNPASTKLRLVSTVDSLRYSEIGFKIKYNQDNIEYTRDTNTVYEELVAIDTDDKAINYVPSLFVATSKYFVAYTILNIGADLFDNYEFAVTPYWVTLDGTTVRGVTRGRLLVTDELATDADGCDFTVSDSTYTYTTTKSEGNKASYQYLTGASDTVYVEGTYTKADANNQFGLSIRNGGEVRQIFFDTNGVKVVNSDMTVSGLVDGKEVTIRDAAAINTMLSAAAGTETKVVWEIKNNVLYCSLGGVEVYEVSMKDLCSDWLSGRYYQVGLAGYNTDATETAAVFVLEQLQFGE